MPVKSTSLRALFLAVAATLIIWRLEPATSLAQDGSARAQETVFSNVRVFDGRQLRLSAPTNVVVRGNKIASIGGTPSAGAVIINGGGYTLMPGLIDVHTHIMLANAILPNLMTGDAGYLNVLAVQAAEQMLMRGFTSIRDMGGPAWGIKRGIDSGVIVGPRIWPSGAAVSQSGGHGDFRFANELPAAPGSFTHTERMGAAAIADGESLVLQRVREQLALGAAQIKLTVGGGISSNFDPIDVTEYTVREIRAAVEAAENWGTYVTVHAYTPRAIRQSIEAGVKCIEHGHLIDDATAGLMAEKGVWWSLQPFIDTGSDARFPENSINRIKQLEVFKGTDTAYALAKKYNIRVAWGVDSLMNPAGARRQNEFLTRMLRWYKPAEVLKMATSDNADLLALSGPRSPYQGAVGVIQEGALADLLLVAGDPVSNLELVEDPARNFVVIMKDGKIHKNSLASR